MSVWLLLMAGRMPVLAWYPLLSTKAASVPNRAANCSSNSRWMAKVPVSSLDEEADGMKLSAVSSLTKLSRNGRLLATPK